YYPDPANALDARYLQEHGVGTVVVTDVATSQLVPGVPNPNPREAARTNPDLAFQRTIGAWDVYTVRAPTALVTDGGSTPSQISVTNGKIEATFADGSGVISVRQNWFPRWQATVNGQAVDVTRASDGTMTIAAPSGPVTVTLTYAVTVWDWAARVAAVLGAMVVAGIAFGLGTRLRGHIPAVLSSNGAPYS
ncbi:MAG: hypothetical protein WBA46_03365, partial [Thermomicrobiales bacterium]